MCLEHHTPPTIQLTVTSIHINLVLPGSQTALNFANRFAYNPDKLTLLSFGQDENQLKQAMGKDWPGFRQQAVFASLFDPQAKGPVFDYSVLESMLLKAREQFFPSRLRNATPLLWQAFDLEASIQDYERLSLGRRRELEYYLQDYQHVQRLQINGQDRTIPLAWRRAQGVIGLTLHTLLPVILLYVGLFGLVNQMEQGALPALMALGLGVGGAGLAYVGGTALWLLLFRNRLPHGYLRYQLRSSRAWLRPINKWLTDRLLE